MLKQLLEKLDKERADLNKIFAQAGQDMDLDKVTDLTGTPEEKRLQIRKLNDGLTELGKKVDEQVELDKIAKANEAALKARHPGHPEPVRKGPVSLTEPEKGMSFGEAFIKSGAHLKENFNKAIDLPEGVNLKTLFETGTGWAVENLRTGRLVEDEQRPVQVLDILPGGRTSMAAVVYMEETTFTNNAVETAEGVAFGEAALALTQRTSTVRKIAVFIPTTDEQLEDVQQAAAYLDRRLRFMLMQRLDGQVLNGTGAGSNLTGILQTSGVNTLSQASVAGYTPLDILYRAMRVCRVTGRAIPSAMVIHPTDFESIRLLKDNNGNYIWGHPSEPGPDRIHGLPIALSDALTVKTALVGDFRQFVELTERRGVTVLVGYNGTDFSEGQKSVRADVRVALPVYRPSAFVNVTLT